jgi:hypothetical protein
VLRHLDDGELMSLSNLGWAAEPSLWVGLVTAVIILLVAFGVPITDDQKVAILGVVSAVLVIVGAFITRSQVTPT